MVSVATISMCFPSIIEPYAFDSIEALRRQGVKVVSFSISKPPADEVSYSLKGYLQETIYLRPLRVVPLIKAAVFSLWFMRQLKDIYVRVLLNGNEDPLRRLKALSHIWLGVYFTLLLQPFHVKHIHAQHGYFGSWAAMIASRLLKVPFSFTLHGSDLLIDQVYLDLKIAECDFCFTISEYNKRYLLERFAPNDPGKILVNRMGVETGTGTGEEGPRGRHDPDRSFVIVCVGSLRPVKNHEFLIRGCAELKKKGVDYSCLIIGPGEQKRRLQELIENLGLVREVKLLGFVDKAQLDEFYSMSDIVVSTSHSEGIPLVLMEAMIRGKPVLAPNITGIPELVKDEETGFLYQSGSLDDFVNKLLSVRDRRDQLEDLGRCAREYVSIKFDKARNLDSFATILIGRTQKHIEEYQVVENSNLQQI